MFSTGGNSRTSPFYSAVMINPATGRDDVEYFAMMVVMAGHMAPEHRAEYHSRTLELLARAVVDDAARRAACRDSCAAAATRVRAWDLFAGE